MRHLTISIGLMGLIAWVSSLLSRLVVVANRHPLEATAIAIILGIALRLSGLIPPETQKALKIYEKILIWGIILIGVNLNFKEIAGQGPRILLIIILSMFITFWLVLFLGRIFRLPTDLSLLLSVGTTICGTTAIAVTAPLIKAKQETISYSVATITLWGLAAIFIYPQLAHGLMINDFNFGLFAGTAIHATPQVVAAGFSFSPLAGKTATAVKLVRNCFMAPLALVIAFWWRRRQSFETRPVAEMTKIRWTKAFPWFLFGYFLLATVNTLGYLPRTGISYLSSFGRTLILISMAGIGLAADFKQIYKVGFKPLLTGLIGALIMAGLSLTFITLIL